MNFIRLGGPVLVVTMLVAGCPKGEGPRSPEFEKARDRYLALQAQDPLGVFSNAEVKTLLPAMDGVPDNSVEKAAAVDLAKTIRDGVAAAEKESADRAKSVADSNKAPAFVPAAPGDSSPPPSDTATPRPAAASVDAGNVDPGPSAGMSQADFSTKYGSCYSKQGAYTDDKGATGETYTLNTTYDCQKRLPTQGNTMVLVSGGRVANIVPKSAVVSSQSFTIGSSQEKPAQAPAAPNPAGPLAGQPQPPPPAPIAAAPVLPAPSSDEITTPPVDPNVNPDAVNK